MYSLTIFKNIYDNKTHRRMDFSSWDQLEELFYKLSEQPFESKKDAYLISPAIYQEGTTLLLALSASQSFVWYFRLRKELNQIESSTSGSVSTLSSVVSQTRKLKTSLACTIFLAAIQVLAVLSLLIEAIVLTLMS